MYTYIAFRFLKIYHIVIRNGQLIPCQRTAAKWCSGRRQRGLPRRSRAIHPCRDGESRRRTRRRQSKHPCLHRDLDAASLHLLPPSAGDFSDAAKPIMTQIANFLKSKGYPLLVNVYPYFARAGDPANVDLDFVLFRPGKMVVRDSGRTYLNLFDLMMDAVYAALEKVGAGDVEIIVSETGWPSDGGADAGVENAQRYVNNLIGHVASGKGTPRRPGKKMDAYIFALFNENMKREGVEQHWGMFYPNLTPVYHLNSHGGKIGSGKRIKTLTVKKQVIFLACLVCLIHPCFGR